MQNWVGSHLISLIAVAVASLVAIFGLTRPSPAAIEVRPREALPSPTVVIYVHVDGAVQFPGVYVLAAGSRLFEAIDSAGGATDDADVRELNLAARVIDGQKLVVPTYPPQKESPTGSEISAAAPIAAQPVPSPVSPSANADAKINLNTATQKILESLPGIGPVTATRIIEYRQANGPFRRIEQLREARLVNGPTYERVRSLVAVS